MLSPLAPRAAAAVPWPVPPRFTGIGGVTAVPKAPAPFDRRKSPLLPFVLPPDEWQVPSEASSTLPPEQPLNSPAISTAVCVWQENACVDVLYCSTPPAEIQLTNDVSPFTPLITWSAVPPVIAAS